ncbi:MAG: hypothetical protein KBT11_07005 [Treponema sp.]|nr:hypothetical protein [Candidatus Treponema equifaecale]
MKKRLGLFLFLGLFAFLLTACNEVLSVVTPGENGEKKINNYVLMLGDTVYDETASMKSWENMDFFKKDIDVNNLLFKIENKKDKMVVFGDEKAAVELTFGEGSYKYKFFASMDALNEAFKF